MGKLFLGGVLFLVGVFLCVTVVGAIPGTVMIFSGGGLMFAGFASLTKSTVKGGIAAGKVIREMKKGEAPVESAALDAPSSAPSAADEIRKLSQLLSEGLLTKEEFDRKKAQLLA